MTLEDQIKRMLGDQLFTIAAQSSEIERLREQLATLKADQPVSGNGGIVMQSPAVSRPTTPGGPAMPT